MKQVVTNKSGELRILEVPDPALQPGFVLVRTVCSLVSPGTEGAQVREGKAGLLTKVREHPREVKQVLAKLKKEGVRSVANQVQEKLAQWRPLGYSLSGTVIAVGEGVDDLAVGDAVACAGAGYAIHAERVCVPRNLVVRHPEGLTHAQAAFVTLGAIALQGVRRAEPTLGERALVVGLGLVGQLATQLLVAAGVRVLVRDLDPARIALARELGAEAALEGDADPEATAAAWTGGVGVDLALICAATRSSAPVDDAARLLRERGRLVVVGDVGLELERGPFYMKELDFTLSKSYGPGRYDPVYEEGGVDYPVGYVRWTEGRNMEAVLDLIARGRLSVDRLVSETVVVDDAPGIYEKIVAGEGGLASVITYPETNVAPSRTVQLTPAAPVEGKAGVLAVGAGYFAKAFHLPNLARQEALHLAGVVSGTGANARQTAERYGASFAGTDLDEALTQPGVDAVLLSTRHHLHVPQALAAIRAGKHVLVEKPLALDREGLRDLAQALQRNPVRLAVGFNRRHAPLVTSLRELLAASGGPIHGVYRMNAGRLPADHWVNDPVEGGGRILGEGVHVFDLFTHLAGTPVRVQASMVRSADDAVIDTDNLTATVTFENGSVLTLLYTTAGPKGYPKEQLEVFAPGLAATLIDYRELAWTGSRSGKKTLRAEDKGQAAEMDAWAGYLTGKDAAVADFQAAALSTWLTLMALESARTGEPREVAATLSEVLG